LTSKISLSDDSNDARTTQQYLFVGIQVIKH